MSDKIARICWNTEGWVKPSGPKGKSKNPKAYEYKTGYGHEEWLLDTTKVIEGWHYGYLQAIGQHRDNYIGKSFRVNLYSINSETKQRWWIGTIKSLAVIDEKESQKIYAIYKKHSWLKEMAAQLDSIRADADDFKEIKPEYFAVIKYKIESLEILDTPLCFAADDPAVRSNYYNLLDFKHMPNLMQNRVGINFVPGHNPKAHKAIVTYEKQKNTIDLTHNLIQEKVYEQLAKRHGKTNIGTEQACGNSSIDLVLKDSDGKYIYFEIKTCTSARLCIREAIGQLMEYAYFNNEIEPKKIIIVAPNAPSPEIINYLATLRKNFSLPVYYQKFNLENDCLEDKIY